MKKSIEDDYVMRLNTIAEYIDDHLDEGLDLKKLAKMSNFSDYHFHRIFKEYHHETLAAYISRIRIERAAYLLLYTNSSIKEISYKVGFEFPSSLSKAFKQLYKITPSEYRLSKKIPAMKKRFMGNEKEQDPDVTHSGFVTLKNMKIIYSRLMGPYSVSRYLDVWQQLLLYAEKHQANSGEPDLIIMYHNDIDLTEASKLRCDVCVTVEKPVPAKGIINVKEIVGGEYAVFSYSGSSARHSSIVNVIFDRWVLNNWYEIRNLPIFEKYINNPMKTKPSRLNTEIYLPIQ